MLWSCWRNIRWWFTKSWQKSSTSSPWRETSKAETTFSATWWVQYNKACEIQTIKITHIMGFWRYCSTIVLQKAHTGGRFKIPPYCQLYVRYLERKVTGCNLYQMLDKWGSALRLYLYWWHYWANIAILLNLWNFACWSFYYVANFLARLFIK